MQTNLAECTHLPTLLEAFGLPEDTDATLGAMPGCFTAKLDAPTYHSTKNTISHTGILHLLRSPAHYKVYMESNRDDSSPNFGTVSHSAILEPLEFNEQYAVFTGVRRGSKWELFAESNSHKLILNQTEYQSILSMKRSVYEFRDFPLGKAIETGEAEKSIFWIDPDTGVQCRIRVDLLTPFVSFDLKTTNDARPQSVLRQSMKLGYPLEAGMYTEGVFRLTGNYQPFVFIFVEDSAPYGVWVQTAGESFVREGTRMFRNGVEAFKKLQETQDFHCYLNACTTLELPKYLIDQGV